MLRTYLSSAALHAAWREEEHGYSPGGIPSHPHSEDLQISSAPEGTVWIGTSVPL